MTAVADVTRGGQLVHLRAVSRKLAFGDLVLDDAQGAGTVRLVFKAWIDRCAPRVPAHGQTFQRPAETRSHAATNQRLDP